MEEQEPPGAGDTTDQRIVRRGRVDGRGAIRGEKLPEDLGVRALVNGARQHHLVLGVRDVETGTIDQVGTARGAEAQGGHPLHQHVNKQVSGNDANQALCVLHWRRNCHDQPLRPGVDIGRGEHEAILGHDVLVPRTLVMVIVRGEVPAGLRAHKRPVFIAHIDPGRLANLVAYQGKGGVLGGVRGRVLRFDVRQCGEGRALLHEPALQGGRHHTHHGFTFGRDLRMQQLAGEQVQPQAHHHQDQGGRGENADEDPVAELRLEDDRSCGHRHVLALMRPGRSPHNLHGTNAAVRPCEYASP